MDLGAARTTLKNALQAIPGLTAYTTVPAKPEVPCAILHPGIIDVHPVMAPRSAADIAFDIQILVQFADWDAAQNALDAYISTGTGFSIVDALENGDDSITVTTIDNYGAVTVGEVTYAGVTFHTQVLA